VIEALMFFPLSAFSQQINEKRVCLTLGFQKEQASVVSSAAEDQNDLLGFLGHEPKLRARVMLLLNVDGERRSCD
jgi:hypothetical protein